jgi:hypothetical protein
LDISSHFQRITLSPEIAGPHFVQGEMVQVTGTPPVHPEAASTLIGWSPTGVEVVVGFRRASVYVRQDGLVLSLLGGLHYSDPTAGAEISELQINWGDGTHMLYEPPLEDVIAHEYSEPGAYTVYVYAKFTEASPVVPHGNVSLNFTRELQEAPPPSDGSGELI